jgi:hypothetical protein
MTGGTIYEREQIMFVLECAAAGDPETTIFRKYRQKFNLNLSHNQARYLKNKYGKDPDYE